MEWNIRGDLHVHAHHTQCDQHKPGDPVDYDNPHCGTVAIAEMEAYLAKRRFAYAGIVNHATDPIQPTPPNAESEGKIALHRHAVDEINTKTIAHHLTLLAGVEASLLPDGTLDVTHETLCGLDLVILSRHGGTTGLVVRDLIPVFKKLFAEEPVHILGHPSRYSPPETLAGMEDVLHICESARVAVELNGEHPFGKQLIDMVAASTVHVALGSDIHLNMLADGTAQSVRDIPEIRTLMEAGILPARIINTWPLPQLRTWLAERKRMCRTEAT